MVTELTNPNELEQRHSDVIQQTEKQAGLRPSGGTPQDFGLPQGATWQPTLLQTQPQEFEAPVAKGPSIQAPVQTASTQGLNVQVPQGFQAPQIEAATVTGQTPTAQAKQGQVSTQAQIDLNQAQGTISGQSLAQAQTEQLDEQATIKYQLGQLYASIEEGKPLPAWASGPVRAASAVMMQRGAGASTMAGAAMVQAVMEAGLPIAAADADKYSKIQLQNLNNKQQTSLYNASVYAAMDKANLDARMTALVTNSRSFLQMDLQNLTNEQTTEQLNFQGKIQTLLSDQAATNAARNFNAQNETQVQEFFAKLGTEVETSNAQRLAAMEQFNTDQVNATNRYNTALEDSRDKFYTQVQREIDQSNVMWRRTINTANTAAINEATRINTQNILGLTVEAQNRMWQQYRDEAKFIMDSSENNRQRAHNAAMLATQNNFTMARYNQEVRDSFWRTAGNVAFDIIKNL
jgi:hypothetical protein